MTQPLSQAPEDPDGEGYDPFASIRQLADKENDMENQEQDHG